MLDIQHLTKTYGEKKAVDDLSLHIAPGEIYGFIGHNGAGKTTTLKSVVGILQFDQGEITIDGRSIKADPLGCKREMAYIPDNPDLYDYMTGIKYLNFIADVFGVDAQTRQARIRTYADAFELTGDLAQPIAAYSHGMKQKLSIIAAWLHDPKVIIMDEPFVGLDPKAAHLLKGMMREICDNGGAIFFSTHVLEVAESSATRWLSSRAAGSSVPAPWRRSRATTPWRRSSWSWRRSDGQIIAEKQLSEIFRSYFYDAKKNKPRSKASTVSLIVLYVLLMVGVIGGMFTLFSIGLCAPLHEAGLDWLYFTLFALVGVLMGVFGSVFNTFSGLYQAKDNDLLLSLPIPVRAILASRLLGVYLMGLMFSGVILLPCVIVYWAVGVLTAATVLGGIALILAVSLLVLVLSCLLGWVVAKIHSKLKRKNLLTTLIALAFFALYYMVCFRANELIEQLMLHLNEVGAAIRGSAYPLYLMGRMGAGDYLAVVLVLAVMAALCALTYLLLSRTFLSIATANNGGAKAVYKETTVRAAGVPAALLRKELGRFTASPNYMLNCGLGTVMLPILGVLLLVKSSDLLPVIYEMAGGEASGLLATMLCAALCLVGSMNDMASSSISLEGKNLWLAQSLPVTPWQVLRAKLLVQVLVTGIPMAVTSVLILLAVRPALPLALLLIALPQAFVWLSAAFGLTMDLKRPNLVWTNEITVIKQRLTVLLAMLGGWVYAALVGVLYYPFGIDMGAAWYLLAWTVLTVVLTLVLLRWLHRTGSRLFAAL